MFLVWLKELFYSENVWKQGDGLYTLGASLRIFLAHIEDTESAQGSYMYVQVQGSPAVWINQFLSFLGESRIASLVNPDMLQQIAPFIFGQHSGWALLCINPIVISLEAGGFYIHSSRFLIHHTLGSTRNTQNFQTSEGWNMAVTKLLDQTGLAFCCLPLPSPVNLLQELVMGRLKVQHHETKQLDTIKQSMKL